MNVCDSELLPKHRFLDLQI